MTLQTSPARPRPVTGGRGQAQARRLRGSDVVAVLVAQAVLIGRCGFATAAPTSSATGPAGILTAIGQVTALYGTYLALIQLVLMSRSPWLDETFGMDGLAFAHRWLGFATVWLLLGHGGRDARSAMRSATGTACSTSSDRSSRPTRTS